VSENPDQEVTVQLQDIRRVACLVGHAWPARVSRRAAQADSSSSAGGVR
jgi:hypothetical protein